MPKSNGASPKPQTHFEQIPVEVVKKVAAPDLPSGKKAGKARVGAKPTSRKKG
jgi:hypothetical protein